MAEGTVIDDPHYTTPIYRKAEAAHIIAVPALISHGISGLAGLLSPPQPPAATGVLRYPAEAE